MSGDFDDIELPPPPAAGDTDGFGSRLDQAGIDALFDSVGPAADTRRSGLKAVIESNVVSHEKLPMLEVICDRMVRSFSTSMRNLTSDSIEVTIDDITPVRFGDFMQRVSLPAMIGVFSVPEWDNYGVMTVDSGLIYGVVDALLGGRKGNNMPKVEGRAFTPIETALVARMMRLALADLAIAFEPIAPVTMLLDRIETVPRFAAIARPSNIAAVATFRVDIDGRGGRFSVLLPYATIEPVRDKLLQRFMGERQSRLNMWGDHMEAEIRRTPVSVELVLGEIEMTLAEIAGLAIGQTIPLNRGPDEAFELRVSGVTLGRGLIGQRGNVIAAALTNDIGRGYRA
ncbi:MAG: flagellar motor switch protein FliM [Pseudomonadota bacterium]|jgi:flagellar motor switch protein FliM